MGETFSHYKLTKPSIIVVMGVSGSGKSTIGRLLADTLDLPFYDADDFHPQGNRYKLRNDIPLTDVDRWPWINEIANQLPAWATKGGAVLACSALKKVYRDALRNKIPEMQFIYLHGTKSLIRSRLAVRDVAQHVLQRHENTVEAQFEDLQPPVNAITIGIEGTRDEILTHILLNLERLKTIKLREMDSRDGTL